MTATTLPSKSPSLVNQLSDWAVIVVTVIALLAGLLFKKRGEPECRFYRLGDIRSNSPGLVGDQCPRE
jgi:hypothetical protein